jgi:hypothetical protein
LANLEEAMTNPVGYAHHLPASVREQALAEGRAQVEHAARRYARLHAGIALRAANPAVDRLTADTFGTSATLIAAYTTRGYRLWHIDTGDAWSDESLVTDHRAAAADWCPSAFEAVEHDRARLYVLDLDDTTRSRPPLAWYVQRIEQHGQPGLVATVVHATPDAEARTITAFQRGGNGGQFYGLAVAAYVDSGPGRPTTGVWSASVRNPPFDSGSAAQAGAVAGVLGRRRWVEQDAVDIGAANRRKYLGGGSFPAGGLR